MAEHPALNSLVSAHAHKTSDNFAPMRNGTYFNKFLVLLCYKLDTSTSIILAVEIVG